MYKWKWYLNVLDTGLNFYVQTADVGWMRFWCWWKLPEKWLTPNEQQMVITGDILVRTQASHWSIAVHSRLWLVLSRWFPKNILPLETSPGVAWWPHVFIFGARVFVTRWWGRQMVRGDRQVHDHMVDNSRVLCVRCRSRPCLDQAILRSAKFTPRWNKTKYFRLRQSYEVRSES